MSVDLVTDVVAYVTGGTPGPPGPPGADGTSVNIVGKVPTSADLPVLGPADAGDGYITENDGHLHVWDGTAWTDVGTIQGPPGATGPAGATGPTGATGPAGQGVPTGGATGQVLAKTSGANFATGWVDQTEGGGGGTGEVPAARRIDTTAPLTGGGDLSANRTLGVSAFGATTNGVVPAPGTIDLAKYLRTDGTWAAPAGSGGGGITVEDAVDAVAAALVAGNNVDIAYNDSANTITIDVEPLTKADVGLTNVDNTADVDKPVSTAQATANNAKADKSVTITPSAPLAGGGDLSGNRTLSVVDFTVSSRGTVPNPGGSSSGRYLRDDATWTVPPTAAPADDSITNAKLANMPTATIKGNNAGSTADPVDLTATQTRTLLGLSSMATATTLAAVNAAISDADVPAALNGLTGVWIGTQAQYDAIGTKVATVLYAIQP